VHSREAIVWVVGTLILLVAGATLIALIGWAPRRRASPVIWDISGLGGIYTGIIGILAGFSVGSATFIAGLGSARGTPAFAAAVGMLLVSFLILIGSAMMYSDTPSFPASDDDFDTVFQSLSYLFANASYLLGLSLGWLALRPLLVMINLPSLADAFTWLLLTTSVAGSARIAVFVYRLTTADGIACIAIPILGIGLPAIYRLLAVRVWPGLWPAADAPIWFAFVAFFVASVGFIHQTGLFLVHGGARLEQRVRQNGHRFALAYLQMVAIAIGLVWFAVATI
jgi:hypothetical protein